MHGVVDVRRVIEATNANRIASLAQSRVPCSGASAGAPISSSDENAFMIMDRWSNSIAAGSCACYGKASVGSKSVVWSAQRKMTLVEHGARVLVSQLCPWHETCVVKASRFSIRAASYSGGLAVVSVLDDVVVVTTHRGRAH